MQEFGVKPLAGAHACVCECRRIVCRSNCPYLGRVSGLRHPQACLTLNPCRYSGLCVRAYIALRCPRQL